MEISDEDIKKIEEEIFILREQRLSYEAISKYFTNQGKRICESSIYRICKKIYKEKEKVEPRAKMESKKGITDEEIFTLREKGLSYEAISKYFSSQGKNISYQAINNRCKKIYERNGKKEPKTKPKSIINITDEEIYNLRKQGLSYETIAQYFISQGRNITVQAISKNCKRIYQEKGKVELRAKTKPKTGITDKEIYKLREQGLSYEVIAEYFTNKGKKVSWESIYSRCKKIYMQKGKEEPRTKTKSITGITDEEIYNLREQGLSYEVIAEHFTSKGRKISWKSICSRCKKIYERNEQEEPKIKRGRPQKISNINEEKEYFQRNINNKDLVKGIMNLIVTRKASLDQIKKIAEIYEVDLEEVLNNSIDER